jgi:hypothetical protein
VVVSGRANSSSSDGHELAAGADHRPRVERVQLQLAVVERVAGLGVGGQQGLEAPVEQEVLDPVGADPAADPVGRLQHGGGDALLVEAAGAAEPGQPGPDDVDAAVLRGHLASWPHGPDRLSVAA